MLELLTQWLTMPDFTLKQVATLHGTLESLTKYCAWARPWFFALQNAMRLILQQRAHWVKRKYNRHRRTQQLREVMPAALANRISQIISREAAQLLWDARHQLNHPMTAAIHFCVQAIFTNLSDRTNDWGQQIGHIIPRDPTFTSLGDASNDAGGGYSDTLRFWFQVNWSPRVRKLITLPTTHKARIHINSLEFVVVILQYAAVLTRLHELDTQAEQSAYLQGGFPALPILQIMTDNTVGMSWANKVTSSSSRGQALIPIFAALLADSPLGINCQHIAGILNTDADFVSRPPSNHLSLSSLERREQIFLQAPRMRSWDIFVPSSEMCSLLTSSLCTGQCPAQPEIPKSLGQFVPGDSISFSLPVI
jgi:hypothetical protein